MFPCVNELYLKKNALGNKNSYWQVKAIAFVSGLKKSICRDICLQICDDLSLPIFFKEPLTQKVMLRESAMV